MRVRLLIHWWRISQLTTLSISNTRKNGEKDGSQYCNCSFECLLHGLRQLDMFMKQLNEVHMYATPGCKGKLTPVRVKSVGLGGAVSIGYNCTGCVSQTVVSKTSAKYELDNPTEVSIAVQIAFIIALCVIVYIKEERERVRVRVWRRRIYCPVWLCEMREREEVLS